MVESSPLRDAILDKEKSEKSKKAQKPDSKSSKSVLEDKELIPIEEIIKQFDEDFLESQKIKSRR